MFLFRKELSPIEWLYILAPQSLVELSGDIIKQPWIRRELFTLAALSMTSLKWASSAMCWVIVLSYELFGNSRVGNISFTSSSTLCFGRIHLQDMICQHAACHILLRIQTIWLKYSVEEFLLRFSSDYRFFCHSTVFIPLRIEKNYRKIQRKQSNNRHFRWV